MPIDKSVILLYNMSMTENQSKRKRGRPKLENPLKLYAIRLDEETYLKAILVGEGNLSKGIRTLIKLGYQSRKVG